MISVFIPAYNEQANIEKAVDEAHKALLGIEHEVLVVDDCSDDDTPLICEKLQQAGLTRHIRYEGAPTRRENLAASFHMGKGEITAFFDADMSAHPRYLPHMIKLLDGADMVLASRFLPQSDTKRNTLRQAWSGISNAFTRKYLGTAVSDHQCGLKAFKREPLLRLVGRMGYDRSGWRGFGWDSELIARATKDRMRIIEIPVSWQDSKKTTVRLLRDFRTIPYMMSLRQSI